MSTAPYPLPIGQPSLPDGEFLLPVCTTRERAGALLNALNFYMIHSGDASVSHIVDVYRALSFVDDPFLSPCLNGGLNCRDVFPDQAGITYEPQNPFTEPDYVPDGYSQPPFFAVEPADTFLLGLGFQVGDVVTDPTRFITGIPEPPYDDFGFPRFRFSWTGGAEIELHLLQFPVGGVVLIATDDDPLSVEVLELNLDIISVPPETVSEIIVERVIATDGEHHIDVTFFPVIREEAPFFGYGGGFRKVTICQGSCMPENYTVDVFQGEDDPCNLYKEINGDEPVVFANLRLCAPLVRPRVGGGIEIWDETTETWETPEPPPIPPRVDGTSEDKRCLAAANAAAVIQLGYEEVRIKYGDSATVLALAVAALAIWGFWFVFPPVIGIVIPIIAAMIAVGGFGAAEFTEDDLEETKCILYCNSSDTSGVITFNFSNVTDEMQSNSFLPVQIAGIMLPLLGENGLNQAGATRSILEATCDCPDCATVWCHEFTGADLLAVWSLSGNGTHTALGFTNTSPLHLTHIEFDYEITGAGTGGDSAAAIFLSNDFTDRAVLVAPLSASGTVTWDGDIEGNEGVAIGANDNSAGGASISITRVLERGIGENPYTENCT